MQLSFPSNLHNSLCIILQCCKEILQIIEYVVKKAGPLTNWILLHSIYVHVDHWVWGKEAGPLPIWILLHLIYVHVDHWVCGEKAGPLPIWILLYLIYVVHWVSFFTMVVQLSFKGGKGGSADRPLK